MTAHVLTFRPKDATRAEWIAQALILSLRPGVDAAAEVLDRIPDLTDRDLYRAFSLAHDALNHLQNSLVRQLRASGGGDAA
jgi:hypothetical protein